MTALQHFSNLSLLGHRQSYGSAIDQFNRREFWECHETLEDVWRATPYPLRFFYHSIIKTAVGFHHLSRHNRHGARVKLTDGVRLLWLFPPRYLGVYTKRLLDETAAWLRLLESETCPDWSTLDFQPIPTIRAEALPKDAGH